MDLSLFPPSRLGTFPFCVANLSAFLEDLLHEIISGEGSARATPILDTRRLRVIGKQRTDLSLQCCHSFFKRRSGHDTTPCMEVACPPKIGPANKGDSG
jgi:hypothetical protein